MARNAEPARLTPSIIEQLKSKTNPETGKRYTQAEIARMWGITPTRVSQIKRSVDGYSETPRERAQRAFPWTVSRPYRNSSLAKRLRDHLEYQATGGDGMDEDKLVRLAAFYQRLRRDNAVVEFHPSIPPSREFGTGGWALRDRRKSDDGLIIRVNGIAEMGEEAYILFRFPSMPPNA